MNSAVKRNTAPTVTYMMNEKSLGEGFTEEEARKMTRLLSRRGYPVKYGFPTSDDHKLVNGIADLLASVGQEDTYDPSQPIVIRSGEPHSPAAAAAIAYEECLRRCERYDRIAFSRWCE